VRALSFLGFGFSLVALARAFKPSPSISPALFLASDRPTAGSLEVSGRLVPHISRQEPPRGLCTRRAPSSSPRHACGLNVAVFLHPCTEPEATPALQIAGL